jgi:pimeloyl-ACP methyl ester carboxylesterase
MMGLPSTEPSTITCGRGKHRYRADDVRLARNTTFWNRWVPPIADSRRVFRPDLLGCGKSDIPALRYAYTPEGIGAQILAVLDSFSLSRVHWVGETSGGIIGLLLAAAYPERIASLILCNTPTRISDEIKSSRRGLTSRRRAA